MNFILDIHCHTVNSGHAYSTIAENAAHAAKIGLTHIGIADHGPDMPGGAHRYHFYNLGALPDYIHGVRILKGIEANILDAQGTLDFPNQYLAMMDFVIASMHREVIPPATCEENTAALVNAMENPNLHVLGHPINTVYEIDLPTVVKAAAKTRTILEMNNHSLIPGSFRYKGEGDYVEMLRLCKEYNVNILASSDAHYHESVGNFTHAKRLIEESGISQELIVNTSIEKLNAAIQNKKEWMK